MASESYVVIERFTGERRWLTAYTDEEGARFDSQSDRRPMLFYQDGAEQMAEFCAGLDAVAVPLSEVVLAGIKAIYDTVGDLQ